MLYHAHLVSSQRNEQSAPCMQYNSNILFRKKSCILFDPRNKTKNISNKYYKNKILFLFLEDYSSHNFWIKKFHRVHKFIIPAKLIVMTKLISLKYYHT
jgi:hypothetical protein